MFLAAADAYLMAQTPSAGVIGAQIALQLIAHCQASSQCNAGFVRTVLRYPEDYFSVPPELNETVAKYRQTVETHLALLERLVADGRRVFDTARSLTSPDRLRAVIRANLRLAAVAVCLTPRETPLAAAPANTAPAALGLDACAAPTGLVELAEAAIDGDLQAALRVAIGAKVFSGSARDHRRLALFLNFVGQAAAVVAGTPEERQVAQAQVEHALEVLLDDAADRAGRDDEWIVSLGSGLRALGACERGGGFRGPVSVPVTLSLDYLAKRDDEDAISVSGFHAELGFLDVGNYLRINDVDPDGDVGDAVDAEDVEWTDIANLSIGVAYFRGNQVAPVYVGVSGGVAPGTSQNDDQRRWIWYAGAFAGLYVPLLDLN